MDEEIIKIIGSNFTRYENKKGEVHNINDEPAFIWKNGSKEWYKNGNLHRTKGPAYIEINGNEYWYYEDINITDKVNQLMEEGRISSVWQNWTEEDEFLFVLLVS